VQADGGPGSPVKGRSVLGIDGGQRGLDVGQRAAQLHHLQHLALDLDFALRERFLPVQLALC
jgi:hypothetical protein